MWHDVVGRDVVRFAMSACVEWENTAKRERERETDRERVERERESREREREKRRERRDKNWQGDTDAWLYMSKGW